MVIGFDGSRVFVKGRTGTENYSYQLLKNLAKIDRKNQYIVYVRPSPSSDGGDEGDSSEVGRKVGWPNNFQFKMILWPRLWTQGGLAIQTFKDKLDVLFVPAHTLPLIRKPGLKTVVTVHDLGSEYLPSMHQLKQRLYLSFMQQHQLQTATKIIAVSKATKKDLIKRVRAGQEKVNVVYEGFDEKLFKPVKGDVLVNSLRQYRLKPGSYFLFVGTVQPRKNLTKLIQAFNQFCHPEGVKRLKDLSTCLRPTFPTRGLGSSNRRVGDSSPRTVWYMAQNDKVKLVIVGQKGWLSDGIYKLPKQLGIKDQVKFLGYVPEKDLPALYSGAIALTFPSLFEGFGLPILEAQACGCPVLTSNVSSMPEVAGKGAVYVSPYSVDDIVKGMNRVKSKQSLRSNDLQESRVKLIKLGLENIKRFSWEKCAAQTLEVLLSS